ncbi:MAG: hypothetical protein ACK5NI_00835 [bacterium]
MPYVNVFFFEFFKYDYKPTDGAVPETIEAKVEEPFQRAIIDSSNQF